MERDWHNPSPAVHLHMNVALLPYSHGGEVQLLLKCYDYELSAQLITARLITMCATLARERWPIFRSLCICIYDYAQGQICPFNVFTCLFLGCFVLFHAAVDYC